MAERLLALIHARESKFEAKAGDRSPEEQVGEGLAWCEREGHDVLYVDGKPAIIESGVGASRHSKSTRDGWARTQRILAGDAPEPKPDILVSWTSSRTTRKLGDYVDLRDLCVAHGVLWCINGRLYDLTNPEDRLATGIMAVTDEHTADRINKDVRRAMRANAVKGRPHGRRLYGYRRVYDEDTGALVRQELHPDEAPVVRRIFTEYLAGSGGASISKGLNADGLTTTTGVSWDARSVYHLLRRPGYAGLRQHQGQVITTNTGAGGADWPALIDPETWEAAQARMEARRSTRQRADARLLTGIVRSGVCGNKLHQQSRYDMPGKRRYACAHDRCVARDADRVDTYVTVCILERLARPDAGELVARAPNPDVVAAKARVVELRAKLDEAFGEWRSGRLSAEMLGRIEAELLPEITAAERLTRKAIVPIHLDLPDDASMLDEWWLALGPERQREAAAALITAVLVMPVRSRWYNDRQATVIEWRS